MSDAQGAITELHEAMSAALREHVTPTSSIVPQFGALSLDRDVRLRPYGKTLHKGIYLATPTDGPTDSTKIELYVMSVDMTALEQLAEESRAEAEEAGLIETVEREDGVTEVRSKVPGSISVRIDPLTVGEAEEPLTVAKVGMWLAVDIAEEEDAERFRRFRELLGTGARREQRRPRKDSISNTCVTMTRTKVEKTVFGDTTEEKRLAADEYDGRDIAVSLGDLGTTLMRITRRGALDMGKDGKKVEEALSDTQRTWLTMLQSCVRDNPERRAFYGSDLLKRFGYQNPLRKNHAETMKEAARAISELTRTVISIDTTKEAAGYRENGSRRVVTRVTNMPLVAGIVSLEEYEDGTRDFVVELTPPTGEPASFALPLYKYAEQKGELDEVSSEVFDFKGCGTVTMKHRRVMLYIYRQARSKKLSDTVLFDTMLPRLGIPEDKDTKYHLTNKLIKLLNDWKRRGIVSSWRWEYKTVRGRKVRKGVTVHLSDEEKRRARTNIPTRE